MITKKNMLLVFSIIAIFFAVAVAIFGLRQLAYMKSLDSDTETLKSVSADDNLDSIQSDIEDTSLENLDKESSEIEVLLN
ncbi:MAG: hypothetical protein Q8L28_01475 [bacterium]|nr:hypothetical protein [bacterium]